MPTFSAEDLRTLLGGAFEAVGYPAGEAALIARLMVDANLAGHDSHGVRQLGRYLGLVAKGHVVAGATIEVVRETPTTAVLEANRALGHVAAARAVEIGVAKARRMRISIVGVRNLDHVGRVGAYPELAAGQGMICLAFVCAQGRGRLVAPFHGIARRLGTNPISAAFPMAGGPPILLDFATSTVAANKVRQAHDRGQQAGEGWLMDAEGNPTRDPRVFLDGGGVMFPLGGEQGYKGYALAVLVDILAGVLTGAGSADVVREMTNNGTLLITIDPEAFLPRADYERQLAGLAAYLRATATRPGGPAVELPGDFEARHRAEREAAGIEIEEPVWQKIVAAVEPLGLAAIPAALAG